jgi:4'-phosphopantetheinyl transferase EntD
MSIGAAREAALRETLPDGVCVVTASEAMWNEPLHPQEASLTSKMSDKRLREFRAGRACARRALAELGHPQQPLLIGSDRQPVWPSGVVGSISHCDDFCAAAAASSQRLSGLGIDVESAEALEASLFALICTESERQTLMASPAPLSHAKIVFSIKESLFKALFPLLNRWIDFLEVDVSLDLESREFCARPSFGVDALATDSIRGRFRIVGGLIFSAVTLPSSA